MTFILQKSLKNHKNQVFEVIILTFVAFDDSIKICLIAVLYGLIINIVITLLIAGTQGINETEHIVNIETSNCAIVGTTNIRKGINMAMIGDSV